MGIDKSDLAARMKEQYENRTRYYLPRRTFSIIRLDGKAWHSYCKNLAKPFDLDLISDIDAAVINILPQIQNAAFAFCQSDEVSILLSDFATPQTDAWFDGNIQKITSISASLMTAELNKLRLARFFNPKEKYKEDKLADYTLYDIANFYKKDVLNFNLAHFDSRVFTIPDRTEVMNYFIFRNNDAARNSISMVAQSLYSHKELQNKNSNEMQEMIFKKGINWAEYPEDLKNGRLISKKYIHSLIKDKNGKIPVGSDDGKGIEYASLSTRTKWESSPAWKFTQDKEKLIDLIPKYP